MDKSAVSERKVYIFYVKISIDKNWDYDGNGGQSYSTFKTVCEKNKQIYFWPKKQTSRIIVLAPGRK